MGIMDTIFGAKPQTTNPQVPPQNLNPQGQQVSPQNIGLASNPNAPSGAGAPATVNGVAPATSGLDTYRELWQANKVEEGATTPMSIVPNLDAAKLRESIKDANFIASIDPNLMQSAMKGDIAAFQQVLNSAIKMGFEQSVIASRSLTETSLNNYGDRQRTDLPQQVKSQMVRESLADNPVYQHEATRPLMAALEQQLSMKYPTATAAEIATHARTYLSDFIKVATPAAPQEPVPMSSRRSDFSDWG
jgi:hypothetical protein